MSHLTAVSNPIVERLRNKTVAYKDAREIWEKHRDEWQRMIADAIDDGVPNKVVAKAVGVSSPRICAIVANVYAHADSVAA